MVFLSLFVATGSMASRSWAIVVASSTSGVAAYPCRIKSAHAVSGVECYVGVGDLEEYCDGEWRIRQKMRWMVVVRLCFLSDLHLRRAGATVASSESWMNDQSQFNHQSSSRRIPVSARQFSPLVSSLAGVK